MAIVLKTLSSSQIRLHRMGEFCSTIRVISSDKPRYFVFMPDLFYEDPIPLNRPGDFDIMKWMHGEYNDKKTAHTPPVVDPIIEKSINAMKTKYGVKVSSVDVMLNRIC